MAATTFANMAFPQHLSHQSQCIDPSDLDNFVDFGAMPSPADGSKASRSRSDSTTASPTNAALALDYDDAPVQPSHPYGRYKQTTGLPTGSYLTGISDAAPPANGFDFGDYNTGLGPDFADAASAMFIGSNSGLALDQDMDFDMPAYFFPTGDTPQDMDFVDPSAINSHDEPQKVRYYPGVHQKQAAMARAQAHAQQQRQQQMLQQQQQQQQQQLLQQQQSQPRKQSAASSSSPSSSSRPAKKPSSPVDARTEETIARVVNQIRQNSSFASDAGSPANSSLGRSRKDDDDMDEDERLLNSEEGKKLSSKERRQLRNKVSARAFRSRRKEYIGQLEGDLATKVNEIQELKAANRALSEENSRFRQLTVKLLRHPAFTPYLEDISRDPALSDSLSKVNESMEKRAAVTESKPQQAEVPVQQDLTVGMTTIPETQLDFSALSLNGTTWGMPNGFGSYQPQVFAVTELPAGPAAPLEVAPKGEHSIIERFSFVDEAKPELPEIRHAVAEPVEAAAQPEIDESDPTMTLYAAPRLSAPSSSEKELVAEPILGGIAPEKAFARIELKLTSASDASALEERLTMLCARADAPYQRLVAMSAEFE